MFRGMPSAETLPISKNEKLKRILQSREHTRLKNGALCFLPDEKLGGATTEAGIKGRIQDALKRWGAVYGVLVRLLSPVWSRTSLRRRQRRILHSYDERSVILNLGSGPGGCPGREDAINIDIFPFVGVDVVADASDLPIQTESTDLILNIAMLEHVPDAEAVVGEMHRVLRAGGQLVCFVPFMQPYHAAPHDYRRWTYSGVQVLLSNFSTLEIISNPGPTSSMLWVVQEWLAITLSLGSKTLHDIFLLLLMVTTFPLKFLDEIVSHYPNAKALASGFWIVARK